MLLLAKVDPELLLNTNFGGRWMLIPNRRHLATVEINTKVRDKNQYLKGWPIYLFDFYKFVIINHWCLWSVSPFVTIFTHSLYVITHEDMTRSEGTAM